MWTVGDVRVCSDAVLLDFWYGFADIFILSCGIVILQNQAVCGFLCYSVQCLYIFLGSFAVFVPPPPPPTPYTTLWTASTFMLYSYCFLNADLETIIIIIHLIVRKKFTNKKKLQNNKLVSGMVYAVPTSQLHALF